MSEEPRRAAKLELYRDPAEAARYDERWRGARGRRRDARKALALERAFALLTEAVGARPRTLLDAPCGTGRFDALWLRLGAAASGADLAPAMLRVARAKRSGACLLAADLARLPFCDRAFDAVACVRFLHLVRDPAHRLRYLRELRRVARLGVIVDWRHGRTLRGWGRRLRWRLGLRAHPPAAPAPERIRAEMAAAGLDVVALVAVRRPRWLGEKLIAVAIPAAADGAD